MLAMGQMIRQIGPNTTRYYWYPGDKKQWLRALVALVSGGAVLGLAYFFTRSWLTATVLGMSAAAGVFGYNLGRRDLEATDTLNERTPRRDAVSAAGRAAWRGVASGAAAAFAALVIVRLPATGFFADWVLPLVPAVVGGLSRQAALLTVRLSRQSQKASEFAGPEATRRITTDPDSAEPSLDDPDATQVAPTSKAQAS
jgi:hypothetical protein